MEYQLDQIGATITAAIATIPFLDRPHPGVIRALCDDDESADFSPPDQVTDAQITAVVHALRTNEANTKCCGICEKDHAMVDCHKLINYVFADLHAKQHPELIAKVLTKYKNTPLPPSRASTSRPGSQRSTRESTPRHTSNRPAALHALIADTSSTPSEPDVDEPPSPEDIGIVNTLNLSDDIWDDWDWSQEELSPLHSVDIDVLDMPTIYNTVHCCDADADFDAPSAQQNGVVAQYDSGANTNLTNQLKYLWNVHSIKHAKVVHDASGHPHNAYHRGYMVLPTADGTGYKAVGTFFAPTIETTVLAPVPICHQYPYLRMVDTSTDIDTHEAIVNFVPHLAQD
jgi:hypothetical protein